MWNLSSKYEVIYWFIVDVFRGCFVSLYSDQLTNLLSLCSKFTGPCEVAILELFLNISYSYLLCGNSILRV